MFNYYFDSKLHTHFSLGARNMEFHFAMMIGSRSHMYGLYVIPHEDSLFCHTPAQTWFVL